MTETEDFLDAPAYTDTANTDGEPTLPPRRHPPAAVVTAGWLVAGLVLGAVGVAAVHLGQGSSATAGAPAASSGQAPGGPGFGGPGAPPGGGFGGGFAGEQHVIGTLAAVDGTSLTVKTASGTSTYTIDATTALVKDGRRVSSLSAMQVGDPVVVHVYPQSGTTHVELVLDGVPQSGNGTVTRT